MATATKQDEDLLIISQDTDDSASDEITFSFDEEDASATKNEGVQTPASEEARSEILEVEDTSKNVTSQEATQSVSENTESSEAMEVDSGLDFSFDLDDSETKTEESVKTEDTTVSESTETTSPETSDFSLDFGSEETASDTSAETTVETAETTSQENNAEIVAGAGAQGDQSMNDILAATIAQLEGRKQAIADEKSQKQSHISEIEEQIAHLQEEESDLKGELKHLENEDEKISANIKKLEEMKLDPVKEHNAKRVVKK